MSRHYLARYVARRTAYDLLRPLIRASLPALLQLAGLLGFLALVALTVWLLAS